LNGFIVKLELQSFFQLHVMDSLWEAGGVTASIVVAPAGGVTPFKCVAPGMWWVAYGIRGLGAKGNRCGRVG